SPVSGWFSADVREGLPLLGGGFLTIDDRIVPSGSKALQPAPDWMKGRAARASVVLGGRAYALQDGPCGAQVYDAEGELCGSIAVAGCSSLLRFGADGAAIAAMAEGNWKVWLGLLR